MKNLHLLPTLSPGRISGTADNLRIESGQLDPDSSYYNIYITSEEAIEFGDYITNGFMVFKWEDDCSLLGRKKIILTTDQNLINDGVQGIDDKFLEWFVNNPTCDSVRVKSVTTIPALQLGSPGGHALYQIITGSPQQHVDIQTKLQKAAEKYENSFKESSGCESVDFIAGAKWQQDNMPIHILDVDNTKVHVESGVVIVEKNDKTIIAYSEQEVLELLNKALTHKDNGEIGNLVTAQGEIRTANFYSWFEQFKK